LSFSHNLFIESALASRVGVNWWFISGLRIALAILAAIFINLLWPLGSEVAQYGLISNSEVTLTSWSSIILHGIQTALLAVLHLSLIVISLMSVMQYLRDLCWLKVISIKFALLIRFLDINEST